MEMCATMATNMLTCATVSSRVTVRTNSSPMGQENDCEEKVLAGRRKPRELC